MILLPKKDHIILKEKKRFVFHTLIEFKKSIIKINHILDLVKQMKYFTISKILFDRNK